MEKQITHAPMDDCLFFRAAGTASRKMSCNALSKLYCQKGYKFPFYVRKVVTETEEEQKEPLPNGNSESGKQKIS